MLGGFLLPFQTIWIIRPGMLGGVPWPFATIGLYASDAVLLLAALAGVRTLFSPPPTGRRSERGWGSRRHALIAFVFLLIAAAMNVWVSVDPWLSVVGWARLVVFLVAVAGIPTWPAPVRRAFLSGFLVAMVGNAVLGFLQFATGHGFASTLLGTAAHDAFVRGDAVVETASGRWLRAYGGFPHPNILGTAILVSLVALITVSSGRTRRSKRRPETSDRLFLVIAGVIASFVFALVLSFSRSALLGLVILLIVCAYQRAMRHLALIGVVIAAIGIALTWSFWVPRVAITNSNETRSVSERTIAFERAIDFLRIPNTALLGTGLHAMSQTIVAIDPVANPYYAAQPVHNVPLLALAEIGLIGTFVLALVLVLLFRHWPLAIGHWPLVIPLVPALLLDHFLWSLSIGLALLFALAVSASLDSSERAVYGTGALD